MDKLSAENPNVLIEGSNWADGLSGMNLRWMPFQGGLGED